jgi:acyl carrier protein
MTQDDLLVDIAAVLASAAGVDPAAVTPERSFDDLDVDSMTLLEAVVAMEDRFGVLIPDDEWSRFSTVADLLDHLRRAGLGTSA